MLNRFFKKRYSKISSELILLFNKELALYPKDESLYISAFTHKSINKKGINNERLEFLGDAVLSSIVGEYLFNRYPNKKEGFLSQMRAKIVSRENLNFYGESLNLEPHINYKRGNVVYKSLLGNVIEALFGAIYLDLGYNKTKAIFINELLLKKSDLANLEKENADYKSRLIIHCQKTKLSLAFKVMEEKEISGKKSFTIGAYIEDELKNTAIGASKREAERLVSKKIILDL